MSNAETLTSQNSHSRAPSISSSILTQGPPNSQSNRPGSSMSSRGQSVPPVVVKKTRTVNSTRPEAAKTARTRKKSPGASNISNSHGSDGAQDSPAILQNAKSADGPKPSENTPISDVDSITSGMKKITINIPSKAQREAREKAKAAVQAGSSSVPGMATIKSLSMHPEQNRVAPPLVSYTDTPIEESTLPASYPSTKSTSPATIPSTPQPLAPSRFAHLQDASKVPLPPSSPLVPNAAHLESPAPNPGPVLRGDGYSNVFVPYQPEGPTPAPMPQQEPLKWLPPNTSTPAAMKRADLPVFTSTTPIPFGVTANKGSLARPSTENGSTQGGTAHAIKQEKSQTSIWEVPDTPQR
jgi:histone deacetylase HOS3